MERKTQPFTSIYRKEAIIRHLYKEIVNGATSKQIIPKLMNDEYHFGYEKCSYDEATKLMTRAHELIKEEFEVEKEIMRPKLVATVNDILHNASLEKDANMRLKAVQELAKMTGGYEPSKLELKQDIVIDFNLSDENTDIE